MIGAMQEPKRQTHDLWTVKELAAAAGLTVGRLRQLLLAGELRGEKIGTTWAIRDSEARRWLSTRRPGTR
jgi:excisionase family DNA binding protein